MQGSKERTLDILLRAFREERDLYRSAVYALAQGLGCARAGITRRGQRGTTEVVAYWEDGAFAEPAGTMIPPDGAAIRRPYHGLDAAPLGELFVVKGPSAEAAAGAEEILAIVCDFIGAQTRLEHAQSHEVRTAQSRTDAPTGFLNRAAFDEDAAMLAERYATGGVRDALVAEIQVPRASDEMLRSFYTRMRRRNRSDDRVYRIDGERFALVLSNSTEFEAQLFVRRVARVMEELQKNGFPEASARMGYAAISHTNGDAEEALRLAASRLGGLGSA